MEAFAALGVASNILTFVDFAWKLLAEARTISKSAAGASKNTIVLRTVVQDIGRLNATLSQKRPLPVDLEKLVDESKEVAAELLLALEALEVDKSKSRWSCFRVALKEVWGKDKTESLANRLSTLQTQITRHVQLTILDKLSGISEAVKELETTNKRLILQSTQDFGALKSDIIQAVERFRQDDLDRARMEIYFQSHQPTNQSSQDTVAAISYDIKQLRLALDRLNQAATATESNQRFLRSLYFDSFQARHQKIDAAHARTFGWIFHNHLPGDGKPPIRFKQWLRSQNGVFWIHGKPGAGKSTLMKFLPNHDSTLRYLHEWAGDQRLIVAKFFFWNSGAPLQKSQEGLLRSLIFEILRQCPDLIPEVKDAVKDVQTQNSSWSLEDLLQIYQTILRKDMPVKFCFFIDGLDEFDEKDRTPADLVRTLRQLEYSSNIKMCVSSRPWTVFYDEFKENSEWVLKLEDLTREDVLQYVTDKFNAHPQFAKLKRRDDRYSSLIENVVNKAQGVFLWVVLVVRTLLEGLTYHDSISTLQRRLNAFPPDLEKFFQHVIDSIPPIYKHQTARLFNVATLASEPLQSITYSFLDDLEDYPGYSLELPLQELSNEQIEYRQDQMRRRLDGRSKGLLELVDSGHDDVRPYFSVQVDFLHRTVRDFLYQSPEFQITLQNNLPKGENIPFTVCYATLAKLKTAPFQRHDRPFVQKYMSELFHFISKAPDKYDFVARAEDVLLEAAAVCEAISAKWSWTNDNWSNLGVGSGTDLTRFISQRLQHLHIIQTESDQQNIEQLRCLLAPEPAGLGRPVLDYVLCHSSNIDNHPINVPVVIALLEHNANPNEIYGAYSVWARFVSTLPRLIRIHPSADLVEITRVLLLHGADQGTRTDTNACPAPSSATAKSLTPSLRSQGAVYSAEPPLRRMAARSNIHFKESSKPVMQVLRSVFGISVVGQLIDEARRSRAPITGPS